MSDARTKLIQQIAQGLNANKQTLLVAITGFDASGKTSFADELAATLAGARNVVKVSIDDFYNPRAEWKKPENPAQSWYSHGYNYEAFREKVLEPLKRASGGPASVTLKHFDRLQDAPLQQEPTQIPAGSIVIVEGIFLARPELAAQFDQLVFIHTPIATLIERGIKRDTGRLGTAEDVFKAYRDTYIGAHRFYMQEAAPHSSAQVAIDNTDFANPKLMDGAARAVAGEQLQRDLVALPSWRFQPVRSTAPRAGI